MKKLKNQIIKKVKTKWTQLLWLLILCSCHPKAVVVGVDLVMKDGKVYEQELDSTFYLLQKVPFNPCVKSEPSYTYLWELTNLETGNL